jgi:aminoglycoside phosphotransferase (APT) family kinase protein
MTTMPVLTPEMILSELGQPAARSIAPVTGGADTQIWRVSLPDGDVALRLLRANQQASAVRERAAMDVAREAGIPAPGVRAVGEVAEQPVMLIDWLPGKPLLHAMYETPWKTWRYGRAFGQMQARIHQIPAPARVIRGEHAGIDWANPDPELAACLRQQASGETVLLHLDYHPLNVLVREGAISGVLDWTNADGGDPRADVARTGAILRFLPVNAAWTSQRNARVRRLLLHGWQQGYQQIAGSPTGMAPFHAWAGMLMQRDLAPRLGRSDLPWLTEAWLARVQRWTDVWRARALQAR